MEYKKLEKLVEGIFMPEIHNKDCSEYAEDLVEIIKGLVSEDMREKIKLFTYEPNKVIKMFGYGVHCIYHTVVKVECTDEVAIIDITNHSNRVQMKHDHDKLMGCRGYIGNYDNSINKRNVKAINKEEIQTDYFDYER